MAIPASEYEAAIRAVNSAGQSYTIGDRTFTRANIQELETLRKSAEGAARVKSGVWLQRVRMGRVQ